MLLTMLYTLTAIVLLVAFWSTTRRVLLAGFGVSVILGVTVMGLLATAAYIGLVVLAVWLGIQGIGLVFSLLSAYPMILVGLIVTAPVLLVLFGVGMARGWFDSKGDCNGA